MGRPPCCDKVGIKKGPWTPEEDIILVSYIQEHGPGNWRSVPTNTGLSRCSKSCRLRWTNYLRPGIKRGNFTPHEEGMIIHLQALLGNKWAAIASYLPQRTDNDIKNYWNTHLKKKLKKFQASGMDPHMASSDSTTNTNTTSHQYLSNKSFNDRRSNNLDISINNNNNASVSSSSTTYASSTENISRLLEGWMRTSPKSQQLKGTQNQLEIQGFEEQNKLVKSVSLPALNLQLQNRTKLDNNDDEKEFDSILSFENLNSAAWDKSTCDSMPEKSSEGCDEKGHHDHDHDGAEKNYRQKSENSNSNTNGAPPLSFLEKWLLDENVGHGEEMMELSPMF